MKIILLTVFILLLNNSYSQNICIKIDSIKVYYLPWYLSTRLSLDEYEVRNFKENYLKKKVLLDSISIVEFSNINLSNNNLLTDTEPLDIRMVIDIYFEKQFITIGLDRILYCNFLGETYSRNKDLNNWISRFVLATDEFLPRR